MSVRFVCSSCIVLFLVVLSAGSAWAVFTPKGDVCLPVMVTVRSADSVVLDVSAVQRYVHASPFVARIVLYGRFNDSPAVVGRYGSVEPDWFNGSVLVLGPDAFDDVTLNREPLWVSIRGASSVSRVCVDYYDAVLLVSSDGRSLPGARVVLVPDDGSHSPMVSFTDSGGRAIVNFLPGVVYRVLVSVGGENYTAWIVFKPSDNGASIPVRVVGEGVGGVSGVNVSGPERRARLPVLGGIIALVFVALLVVLLVRRASRYRSG